MSWKMVKLDMISTIVRGSSPRPQGDPRYYGGFIPRLMIEDLTRDGKYVIPQVDSLTDEGAKLSRPMKKGDLVMTVSGRTGVPAILNVDCCIHDGFVGFRDLSKDVDIDYIYHYLSSLTTITSQQAVGAIFKNLTTDQLKNIEIPLPPLPIQKQIAAILDAADALKRKDQELLKKYDELAQAIFIEMFGDPVKNEKGWEVKRLGDCIENIQIGPFGTQLHESDYVKNGIPVINPMHIGELKIKPNSNYSISSEKYLELPQYHLKKDDIVLARRGEMGRCAIVVGDEGYLLCGTGSLYLTVNKNVLDSLFLVYLLSRKTTKLALENVAAGTTMANLNKNIMNDFKIILPNIKLQQEFSKSIKISEYNIVSINNLIQKSETLFNSLLQKAFQGDLVVEE